MLSRPHLTFLICASVLLAPPTFAQATTGTVTAENLADDAADPPPAATTAPPKPERQPTCGARDCRLISRPAFEEAVDDHLETCERLGKDPQRPYSGKVMLRLDPSLHARAAMSAKAQGKSLNVWAQEALRKAVSS